MEDPGPSILFIGIGLCLLILAFTSAVDAAFTRISRHRLGALIHEGGPRGRAVSRLIDDPYRFKSTILLLNTLATVIAAGLTLSYVEDRPVLWQIGALSGLIVAILLISEVIPKAFAARNPDAMAARLARPLHMIARLFAPLTGLINLITRPLFRLISGKDAPPSPLVTEEELRLLVNVSEEAGIIEHEEREMIEGVMAFGDTLLREIMVPRVDIVAIEVETSLDEALNLLIVEGHSRVPVYEESLDRIIGILVVKDLLPLLRVGQHEVDLRELVRPVHFVPETVRVNVLMADLQARKLQVAIAIDEYGVVSGLATMEDLVEQIVGAIHDEYDDAEANLREVEDGIFVVNATVAIDDLNAAAGLHLEANGADRIGGLVYEQLGRIPRVGDIIRLEEATITVITVEGFRPRELQVVRMVPVSSQEGEERERGLRTVRERRGGSFQVGEQIHDAT